MPRSELAYRYCTLNGHSPAAYSRTLQEMREIFRQWYPGDTITFKGEDAPNDCWVLAGSNRVGYLDRAWREFPK